MTIHRLIRLTILASAATVLASGAALAQGGEYEGYQQQQPPSAEDFSDSDLQAFAEVQQEIGEITRDYQSKMQGTQDPAEVAELRQKANQETIEAVREAGLDVARYNAIANAVRSDPELAEKVRGGM